MNAQIIYDATGKHPEFAVLPWAEYQKLITAEHENETIPFDVANYINNPIKVARLKANWTQVQLAEALEVTQAYIGKIERSSYSPTAQLIERITRVINSKPA